MRLDDFVIAVHKVAERRPPAAGGEASDFVDIERDELLGVENIDPLVQACVRRERGNDGDAGGQGDDDGPQAGVEVFPAAADEALTGSGRDMDRDVAYEEIAASAPRSIGHCKAVVLDLPGAECALQLGPDQMLEHRAGVPHAFALAPAASGLAQQAGDNCADSR